MRFMNEDERKCPHLVAKVVVGTLLQFGCGTFDCGHTQAYDRPFHLVELEDGRFIAVCDDCNKGEQAHSIVHH
ncbi:MAG: hypothetical protein V1736_08825 [Pseudomonadota bacterium]